MRADMILYYTRGEPERNEGQVPGLGKHANGHENEDNNDDDYYCQSSQDCFIEGTKSALIPSF